MFELILVGFAVEFVIFLYTGLTALRERSAIALLVAAETPEQQRAVIEKLPSSHRVAIGELIEDLVDTKKPLDDSLVKAVVRAANVPFSSPLSIRIGAALVISLILLSPVTVALLTTADKIAEAWSVVQKIESSMAYIEVQNLLQTPFELLHVAFQSSALLLAGLAVLWGVRWSISRPAVREARLVHALLEVAINVRPGQPAPVGGRLSSIIAPERGIRLPVVAAIACLSCITLAWFFLYETADVKAENMVEPAFDVWPKEQRYLVEKRPDLVLPSYRGGSPVPMPPPPSLSIGPSSVFFSSFPITDLENQRLSPTWETEAADVTAKVEEYRESTKKKEMEMLVLGHETVPLNTVLLVLDHLERRYQVRSFVLLLERRVRFEQKKGVLQAVLPMELQGQQKKKSAFTIQIEKDKITISPESKTYEYSKGLWQRRLRQEARRALSQSSNPVVAVKTVRDIPYARIVEILAAADTACTGRWDCGLPGLGLRFVLMP